MKNDPVLIVHPDDFPIFLKAKMGQASVAEYAKFLGVTVQLVYLLLKGERTPSTAILKKVGLETYYGVPAPSSKK